MAIITPTEIRVVDFNVGTPKIYFQSPVALVSDRVNTDLPQFVREDHRKFVEFLEEYYKYCELTHNVQFDISRIRDYQDIDTTVDYFVEQFYREYLTNIPRYMLADKSIVVKNIKEFYRARGSEKSYSFLFKIVFDKIVELYYPRTDILRTSDGKWHRPFILRVQSISGSDVFAFAEKIVEYGLTNSSALVDSVRKNIIDGVEFYELYLNSSSVSGEFNAGFVVNVRGNSDIKARIYPVITRVEVVSGGENLLEDSIKSIELVGSSSGTGAEFSPVIVDGRLKSVIVSQPGINYKDAKIELKFKDEIGEEGKEFDPPPVAYAYTGGLFRYAGEFLNEDGHLSSFKKIHDGWFYQQFSYVTYVDESLNYYKDIVEKLVHPAGLKLFGGFRSQTWLKPKLKSPEAGLQMIRVKEHYWDVYKVLDEFLNVLHINPDLNSAIEWRDQYYSSGTISHELSKVPVGDFYNLPDYFRPIDAKLKVHSVEMKIVKRRESEDNVAMIGPTYKSIDREKFYYRPYDRYDSTTDMIAPNELYWGDFADMLSQYANYQLKDFYHLTIGEVIDKPWHKTNISPEPVVFKTG